MIPCMDEHTYIDTHTHQHIFKLCIIPAVSLLLNRFQQRAKRVEFLPVCCQNEAFLSSNSHSLHQIGPTLSLNQASKPSGIQPMDHKHSMNPYFVVFLQRLLYVSNGF